MIDFVKFRTDNGLRVILHHDPSTPLAVVNVLYDVGSRDEDPERTGFAHLFEHLMFSGTPHVPDYDRHVQEAGGENNAFTSADITNYYIIVPKNNLETALWLESDRMSGLAFSKKGLEVQRKVVIEEFKQSYLNQPYGDVWMLLRPLAYQVHPYQWNTIGKDISHIENAGMKEVKDFFKKFYCPSNAIISVSGNLDYDEAMKLVNKWFTPIPAGRAHVRKLPEEPVQKEKRMLTVNRKVPYPVIVKAYHMAARLEEDVYPADLISDILSNGLSSRLYNSLYKKKKIFSEINAYITGNIDRGLFVVRGMLRPGVSIEKAEKELDLEINKICMAQVKERELQKVKNKVETAMILSNTNIANKSLNLAIYELLGDAGMINTELTQYQKVSCDDIQRVATGLFTENNSSVLYYLPENDKIK